MPRNISIPSICLLTLFAYRAPSLAGSGITDPDYYWHLAYGEWILDVLRLPTTDAWTWTHHGHVYQLTQWAGEVILAVAHRYFGGTSGTSALAALLVTLTIAASYQAARHWLPNRLAALSVAFGANALLVSLACRPHQFTHLCLALLSWCLSAHLNGQRRALWFLPPLFALWVNLHGGYAFGLTYLGLFIAAAGAATVLETPQLGPWFRAMRPLLVAFAVSLLATLANPYGWDAWRYAVTIASLKSSSSGVVDEWAATSIKSEVGLHFFMVTASFIASVGFSRRRPGTAHLLTGLALIAIGWSAVRLSLMSSVLLVPWIAMALKDTRFYDLAFDGAARRYDREVHSLAAVGMVTVVAGLSVLLARIDRTTERFMATHFPVAEAQFIASQRLHGRLLNTAEAGGYLRRTLGVPVSFDTRYDLYGDKAFFELLFALRGDPLWKDYFARLDPDIVLLNNATILRGVLAESGRYRPVFEGPAYTVLIRASARPDLPTIPVVSPNLQLLLQLSS